MSLLHSNHPIPVRPPLRVAIIGFGLIGSSIARAIKKKSKEQEPLAHLISAYDLSDKSTQNKLHQLKKTGLIDEVGHPQFKDLDLADMIVICTPVGKMKEIFKKIKNFAREDCLITDSGSTKNSVIEDAKEVYGFLPKHFVPAHPLAGSEKTGFNSGNSDLFQNKLCLICPSKKTDIESTKKVIEFWKLTNARIEYLDLSQHDYLLAHTSHLPHLLSYCLVNVLLDSNESILDFASSGFAGISRLASSDANLWVDILLSNKDEIFIALDHLQKDLSQAKKKLQKNDKKALIKYFLRAKKARDKHIEKYPDIFK